MTETVYDRFRRPYILVFDFPADSQLLIVKVFDGKAQIGCANCIIEGELMRLGDIHIFEDVRAHESRLARFVRTLTRQKPKTVDYRGRGIGTNVLLAVLKYAREHGASEVKGQIGSLDWKRNPDLPNWYRKHGFSVSETGDMSLKLSEQKS